MAMNRLKSISAVLLAGIVLLPVLLNSCGTSEPAIDPKDLSYLYNPTKNPINPRYNITSVADDLAEFSVKFFTSDLFFSEANPRGVPMAMMLVTVKLFRIDEEAMMADTAVFNLNIAKEPGKTEYIYKANLKVEKGHEYIAEVKILDKLRLSVIQAFVPYNSKSDFSRFNYKAVGHYEKNELFNPILRANEYVNLVYEKGPADTLFISFYKPFTPIPDPPSLLLPEKSLNYKPDTVVAVPYSPSMPIMFPRKGIYVCSVNNKVNDGYTFLNLGKDFPTMRTPQEMIEPLAYLASMDEMDELRNAPKPKAALDEFWIKCGGNIDKSRELIRIYYTRVLYSNFYFTSYREGWRTERGMIYIVYGPPDKVYKSPQGESWGYRKPAARSKWGSRYSVKDDYIFFNFRKKDNFLSDNDFFLSRSETLVTYWDQAIASWRKGIVFRVDNPPDL